MKTATLNFIQCRKRWRSEISNHDDKRILQDAPFMCRQISVYHERGAIGSFISISGTEFWCADWPQVFRRKWREAKVSPIEHPRTSLKIVETGPWRQEKMLANSCNGLVIWGFPNLQSSLLMTSSNWRWSAMTLVETFYVVFLKKYQRFSFLYATMLKIILITG